MSNSPPTTHRISEFTKWNKERSLELAPPFQRKPVWSDRNRSFLIDTILKGLPVPEIYIQVKTDKDGNTKYVVVDGQQRIRSILDFIEGEFALMEEESPEFANKEFKDLSEGVRTDFWDYSIVTRELKTSSEADIKSIFLRLNKYVVPLNSQELRNATYNGHFITMVNQIVDIDEFWAENKIVSPSQIKRMLDAEFVSELFIAMIHGIQAKEAKDIDGFYLKYDKTFSDMQEWRKKFEATESKINDILNGEISKSRWHRQPDFYALFQAVYSLSQTYYFPEDRYENIRKKLLDFSSEVDKYIPSTKKAADVLVSVYIENVERATANKFPRQKRCDIIREIMIPFLIAKDSHRAFTEEERRIVWNLSKDKKCAICGRTIRFEDLNVDHKIPHSKGGKTEIANAQITHKSCNVKKSNKAS
jgi:5-methylcytosine-specific restriction endonuclease McrA